MSKPLVFSFGYVLVGANGEEPKRIPVARESIVSRGTKISSQVRHMFDCSSTAARMIPPSLHSELSEHFQILDTIRGHRPGVTDTPVGLSSYASQTLDAADVGILDGLDAEDLVI